MPPKTAAECSELPGVKAGANAVAALAGTRLAYGNCKRLNHAKGAFYGDVRKRFR